ncbi:MAG: hypothetical protein A2266_07775 [Bacteroidetes bacterium RIFOXYA12_FULL_40_10]|nr:MAG: hypothetical protein A2266_07775 [Bacteroidetes bacterium RIFOXYA12_FULL_40_10]
MKTKILSLFLLLLIPVLAGSQEKVIEKSGPKPKWVNGLEKDYVIVVGTGATLDLARQQALMMIKESIVEAIAVNVKTNTNIRTEEVSNRKNVFMFLETFSSNTTSESQKVPFLQGISLAQAEGFYWEKLQSRELGTQYAYHIRYPFPVVDMNRLAFEFKLRDEELTAKLERLSAETFYPSSVEEIESIIGELRILADYFMDGRRDVANLAIRRYNSMLSSIELSDAGSTLGTVRYVLKLGSRMITTVKKPIIRSECAKFTGTDQYQGVWSIKYDHSDCYGDLKNNIVVRYRFGSNNVEKIFYFDINQTKVDIFVSQAIGFRKEKLAEDSVARAKVDIAISSKTDAPFTVTKVILEFKGLPQIIVENINQSFSGKGIHNLSLVVETPVNIVQSSSLGKTVVQMNGFIQYINNTSGESGTYRIYNQTYNTDW